MIALLVKNNIDLDSLFKSHFYNNPNNYVLIEHVYGKLKGYDFSQTSKQCFNERGYRYFCFETVETPNGHEMDLDSLKIEFINDSLVISDQEVSYKYEVDEHCLIYLNEEELNIGQKILTEEEIRRSERQLYDNLKSYREEHERNMRSSLEFAKSYYVK